MRKWLGRLIVVFFSLGICTPVYGELFQDKAESRFELTPLEIKPGNLNEAPRGPAFVALRRHSYGASATEATSAEWAKPRVADPFSVAVAVNPKWSTSPSRKTFWDKTKTKVGVTISTDYWMPKGSFSMVGSPEDSTNSWKLKHPVDSNLYFGKFTVFEIKLTHAILLDFAYGRGKLKKGRLVDTDWDPAGVITNLSYSTSEGKTRYLSVFLSYRLVGSSRLGRDSAVATSPLRTKIPDKTNQVSTTTLDICLGYHQLKNSVSYRDPLILIDKDKPTNEGTSSKEEWLTYDLTYRGIGVRLKGEYRLSNALTLSGLVGYLPSLDARYRGTRYPERTPAPPPGEGNPVDLGYPYYRGYQKQERIKAKGQAPEAQVKLCIYPTTNLSFWVGYKYINFEAEGKDESGTWWAGSEEELKTDLKGWLYGISYQF